MKKMLLSMIIVLLSITYVLAKAPRQVKLEKLWEVELPLAETAQYDAKSGIIYVTGMGAEPNTGTVWKISLDGDVITKGWVAGLNQVRGSRLSGNFLFIAELQSLAKIDITTGKVVKRYPAPDAAMFNNIAIDPSGNLYITDTPKNAIYKYSNDKDVYEKWLESPDLEWPNGILYDNGQLVLAPWGTVTNPKTWETEVPGRMKIISLKTKEIKFLGGNEKPLANGDGLVGDGKGNYFVGDWMNGNIYLVNQKSESTLIGSVNQGMGDFTYIPDKKILLVPVGKINKIIAFKVVD